MIEIKVVTKRSDLKRFIEFPNNLYRNNEFYVPYLTVDELSNLNLKIEKNNADNYALKCFLAIKDGKIAGRIAAIRCNRHNDITGEKRLRFTRFDVINDYEVFKSLMDSVVSYAKELGMDIIHGPLGYNDLDREGVLTYGYDQPGNFETLYNYPYYCEFLERYGFIPDAVWKEYKIFIPEKVDERINRVAASVMERKKLHYYNIKSSSELINRYGKEIFKLIDEAYGELYGVIPLTEKEVDNIISQFKLILNKRYISLVLDEQEKLIGFGLAFSSMSEAVRKSCGRLFPFGVFRILNAVKNPKIIDLALIAVKKEYQNFGVTGIIMKQIIQNAIEDGILYAESNPELVNNLAMQQQWKNFERVEHHKARAVYTLTI